jgi:tripartite-type tricarboxylate transporter receptor subunit TctC
MKKNLACFVLASLTGGLLSISALAQSPATFPSKTITLVVPFTPSSGSDIIARIIAPKLATK